LKSSRDAADDPPVMTFRGPSELQNMPAAFTRVQSALERIKIIISYNAQPVQGLDVDKFRDVERTL